ncbi:MAG: N-6 DNA methylase [Gracilimonas sp.]
MNYFLIEKYIQENKECVVKELDLDSSKIKYSDALSSYRDITKITGPEELVRAYLLTKLVNELGYKQELIELEKEYDIGRPKVNKPRIDVIVRDEDGNAFLYIEVKSSQEFEKDKDEIIEKQLYNLSAQEVGQAKQVKYLVLFSIDTINDEIKDKAIIIDHEKYPAFQDWKEDRNFTDKIPERYGKAVKEPFIKGGEKDLEINFTHEQLESLRKNLHNVLWGGGGTDDNEIFSALTNLILAKIQDESEKKNGEKYDFQIFSFAEDGDEEFETKETIFNRINTLYKRALKQRLNISDQNKLKKSFVIDENKFSLEKLKYTIQELEKFSFVDGKNSFNGKDILGDFFESIITEGFKQTKGQFFTHINIVKFLLWGLKIDKLAISRINDNLEIPYMIDPSAGSGTFLIEYMKFITNNIKYRFKDELHNTRDIEDKLSLWFQPDHRENKWAQDYIYGSEINFNLGTATKVNMILHGDGSSNIFVKDGLQPFKNYSKESAPNYLKQYEPDSLYEEKQVNKQFDVIITNPPFSVDLDNETKKNVKKEFIFGGKRNSENLFIERWYQLLKPNGRVGAVLPESIFDTAENKYIRLFIYKYFKIKSVVSLPPLTFEPFTSTKTSLIFAQKKTPSEVQKWNKLWKKYSNEWSYLKTRATKELEHFVEGKNISKKWSISKESTEKRKENILKLLMNQHDDSDTSLSLEELVTKFQVELSDLCKYDNDTKDFLGFVNTWWVFSQVVQELETDIFMIGVDNIGYKRTKRSTKIMPNDLYRESQSGEVILDDGKKETALDYLREIKWD